MSRAVGGVNTCCRVGSDGDAKDRFTPMNLNTSSGQVTGIIHSTFTLFILHLFLFEFLFMRKSGGYLDGYEYRERIC